MSEDDGPVFNWWKGGKDIRGTKIMGEKEETIPFAVVQSNLSELPKPCPAGK